MRGRTGLHIIKSNNNKILNEIQYKDLTEKVKQYKQKHYQCQYSLMFCIDLRKKYTPDIRNQCDQ